MGRPILRTMTSSLLAGGILGACSLISDVDSLLCPQDEPDCDDEPIEIASGGQPSGGMDGGGAPSTGGEPISSGGAPNPGGAPSTGGSQPAPVCETGVPNGSRNVCCHPDCATCGGSSCGSDPLGAANCCSGEIIDTQSSCRLTEAPCHLIDNRCPNPGDLVLEYQNGEPSLLSDRIRPHFRIHNQSGQDVEYSYLRIRYYFTEDTGANVNYTCTLAFGLNNADGCSDLVSSDIVPFIAEDTNQFLDLSFNNSEETLPATQASSEFKGYILLPSSGDFDQSNDYSFSDDAKYTGDDYASWDNVALFCDGELMDGRVPQ